MRSQNLAHGKKNLNTAPLTKRNKPAIRHDRRVAVKNVGEKNFKVYNINYRVFSHLKVSGVLGFLNKAVGF